MSDEDKRKNQDNTSDIVICSCLKEVSRTNLSRHMQTGSHKKRMKQIQDNEVKTDGEIIMKIIEKRVDEKLQDLVDEKIQNLDKRLRKLEG